MELLALRVLGPPHWTEENELMFRGQLGVNSPFLMVIYGHIWLYITICGYIYIYIIYIDNHIC